MNVLIQYYINNIKYVIRNSFFKTDWTYRLIKNSYNVGTETVAIYLQ